MSEKLALPDDLIAEIDRLAPQLTFLDHYAVLGVSEAATESEIKTAYLRVIKRFHPDRWHSRDHGTHRKRMEAIFSRATEAYEVLRHPTSKLEYDRSLYEVRGIARPSASPAAIPPPQAPAPPTSRPRAASVTELAKAVRLMDQLRPSSATPRAALSAPTRGPTPTHAPTPAPNGRPPILIVEDDDTLRRMLVRILSDLGNISEAREGGEALSLLARDPLPRIVVTDVMMPNVDGLELARRMKADPRTSRIPIVMLTAKQGSRDVIDGVNAGARVYVTKPFKVEDLLAKVKKAMGL